MKPVKYPPAIESILNLPEKPIDGGYDYAGTLGGIRGTWHRLWAALFYQELKMFGDTPEVLAADDELVFLIKNEFEAKFGRALSVDEFNRLRSDAKSQSEDAKSYLGM